ncbi:proline--tRNA ligase [uncultured Thermosynechococcus sp.]|uniref:proline--tRNA ligase n=1 Tax=uncultured Thermosynechococcus sp. TaxID=436945 RepID=UPI00260B5BC0|nr:proline--tRNA ligase [uncultured Thermosynechococcus sp.]
MRLSQMLFVTLRDDPAEAEIPSHKLLLRAGYIRRIASGIYSYLPLMWRVLQKVSAIVREEMNRTGALECLLPQLQPAELWQESGRWDTYTKAEGIMFSLTDRSQRQLGLGPTHEEVITTLAKDLIRSYRQLPVHLYQIQTKFRDEIRPRFGLMRGREFIMKDGYSFHADVASLKETYQVMYDTYSRILHRCGLTFRVVEADSGAIGGSASHEFMVLAASGEDEVLYTADGQYAANVEKAVSLPPDPLPTTYKKVTTLETPNAATIDALVEQLQCHPSQIVKNVLYRAVFDNGRVGLVLVSIRGDQEVNSVKLHNTLTSLAPNYGATKLLDLRLAEADTAQEWAATPIPFGYIGPDLEDAVIKADPQIIPRWIRIADHSVTELQRFITGANRDQQHRVGVNWGKACPLPAIVADVRKAQAGDRACHDPNQYLESARGIEIGHIFQLGTKYSQAMQATYTNEQGENVPLVMGCYGIGVSRLAQAAVEQHHDAQGIIWPLAIAPYQVIIVVPNIEDSQQLQVATDLYERLQAAGIEVLLDDRDERAGVKFKDADLIGIPYRLVTGRAIANGEVELVIRATGEKINLPLTEVVRYLKKEITQQLAQ